MKERMAVALRVLESVQRRVPPDAADIELLKGWVDPTEQSFDDDVMACIIINEEMKRRKEDRDMLDGRTSVNSKNVQ